MEASTSFSPSFVQQSEVSQPEPRLNHLPLTDQRYLDYLARAGLKKADEATALHRDGFQGQVHALPTRLPRDHLDLKEVTVVGHRLEILDLKMTDLLGEMKSTHTAHHLSSMESRVELFPDRDQELHTLHDKVVDLEDRRCRDNVHFFGIP
ncbi:hypothetical protein NDU88_007007 [Pleurodeles waltl]|uniref:Uncharacterized protein n=1 Tax=Pleurodeles waltl TaxID=8319 RepID=A0AAV7P107_PLEWA|nr:hypothetical protein NDU88_007007 [Pleurodeles waltl]